MNTEVSNVISKKDIETVIATLVNESYGNSKNKGFWEDEERIMLHLEATLPELTSVVHQAFVSQKLDLIHSEVSEALEAARHGFPESEKLPDYGNFEEELADACIRIFDLCGKMDLDLGGAIIAKMKYNATRPHKHGKKF